MALSDKGLKLGRDLVEKARELGLDIETAMPVQLTPLFPLLPQALVDEAIATSPKELDPDDVLAVFVKLLVSQLPEERPKKAVAPWAKKTSPRPRRR